MLHVYPRGTFARDDHSLMEGPFEPSKVETTGVMTGQQQIERILAAGIISRNWRQDHYPPVDDVPSDFQPLAYEPDWLDVVDEAREVMRGKTAAAARKVVAERKAAELKDQASEASVSPVDGVVAPE